MGSELNDPSAIAPPLRPAEMFKVWSPCCNNQSGWFFLVPRLAIFLSAIQSWMISWVKRKYVSSSVITCHQILTFVLGTTLGRPRHRWVPAPTWREIALQKYWQSVEVLENSILTSNCIKSVSERKGGCARCLWNQSLKIFGGWELAL